MGAMDSATRTGIFPQAIGMDGKTSSRNWLGDPDPWRSRAA